MHNDPLYQLAMLRLSEDRRRAALRRHRRTTLQRRPTARRISHRTSLTS